MSCETDTVELPMKDLPEVWAEPAYVQWATALAESPTWGSVPPPTEEEKGSIFESVYREIVLNEKPKARVPQKRKASSRGGQA